MRIKLAKYISETLVKNGITQNFSVTGGGAMHLNDAFGHQKGMHTLYQHHEQACAMAAEAYARIYNRPALLCVTSGPGGTNAITGVLGAWLDSIPMIVVSGQVRYDNTARWAEEQNGTRLRAMGDQEFEITKSITCMTKYAEMLSDPMRVRYAVEKCIYLSQTGRPGPVWLDIPVDVQGTFIETDDLVGFDPEDYEAGGDGWRKYEILDKNSALSESKVQSDEKALNKDAETPDSSNSDTAELLKQTAASSNANTADASELSNADALALLNKAGINSNLHLRFEDGNTADREKPVPPLDPTIPKKIIEKVAASKRPIFYTGNGIRIAGAETLFLEVAHRLNIPIVVGWNAPDIIPTEDPLYVGRPGGRGDRPGNIAVQNSDLILSIGSRLNIRQVGYNFTTWAREAYVIVNDIDADELRKPSVHCDLPVHADARALLKALLHELDKMGVTRDNPLFKGGEGMNREDAASICHTEKAKEVVGGAASNLTWLETCAFYRQNYPTVLPEHFTPNSEAPDKQDDPENRANVYAVVDVISRMAEPGQVTVVGNGSPCVAGGQAYIIKNGTRFISQDGVASMGYGLPAAIGAAVAVHSVNASGDPSYHETVDERLQAEIRDPYWTGKEETYPPYEKHDIILLTGDGSIQMNLQELQTIISHKLPIKIFLINNGGYHSIRQTQSNLFKGEPLVGIGVDSGVEGINDLSFPDMEKLAAAYGYPFMRVWHNQDLEAAVQKTFDTEGPVICEIMVTMSQQFLPKSAAKKLPDGSIVSPPLEDMDPYLSDDEMNKVMLVKRVN
ncbi:Thiamine pyrophosphate enzyme, C-terminal TPP binding domain [Oribacterium sp. KHPX15]|uniref:thiamine pyrophosphate-binding protein n=1 Tax=Oribacterium sp. KHPX15 TaxID=1855342 RepID=UPI0008958D49|nr:thiamine pyrophosphate-binding protein [Oribacterium sp. KHPX15]SEA57371.1 Thiamine pyrophosphate enzyme, C-terminal TPP binding domain [Oribacterium sp. KHPX15]